MSLDGTWTGLKASVADFLNRGDLTAVIPDFITLFEAQVRDRMLRDGPLREQMTVATPFTVSTEYTNLPANFQKVETLFFDGSPIADGKIVTPQEIVRLKRMYVNSQASGTWSRVAIVGTQMQVWPIPSTPATAEMTYFAKLPALGVSTASNWLLLKRPDLYLYGALMQSAPYLKDDDRISVWSNFALTGMDDMCAAGRIERSGRDIALPVAAEDRP